MDIFGQKLGLVKNISTKLENQQAVQSAQKPEKTLEVIEELQCALEELFVAEEEIKAQNEELAIAHDQIAAERQRYQELFEFAPDGYLVTDPSGIVREHNQAAASLLNMPKSALVGKPLANYIALKDRHALRYQLNRVQELERLPEWEINICPRQSQPFAAAITIATVRDRQGKVTDLRCMIRDITARKQAEEKLQKIQVQNLQLQESAKLKSHFLAIMSHELRSPMNAIIGFSQILLRQAPPNLASNQANMVERIFSNGKHLLKLIDEILDFARIEAGRMELKLAEFNLVQLVKETVEESRSLAEQKNLVLEVELNLTNPNIVNDSDRLRQVLINLISNAIKFTGEGKVAVTVEELWSDRLAIAVKDTGIGIAEADIEHIFDEFRQANQTITRQHGGTGLGLAICDRLVRLMQGKIDVESKLGEGSTFTIEIPRRVEVGNNN
ncbi:histidine kinase [Aliterella atlantica CENA595]|uniref:histidine kinase n=1 Tax=Aliterella atlantica CENA595 TaxID=1618023 RepID=A0A0D8ZVF2_9CYAN|nr:histidine kinase [Aliterella atlantica CENA595]